jgi:hypothetical protein
MAKERKQDVALMKATKEYVRQQIRTMKAHGARPKITPDTFESIVQKVAAATKYSV